jgi:serine/threonine protein kinase
MWSLGCITVVLLIGGSPFVNSKTNQYCQKLAQKCDLKQLDDDAEWQLVGKRPKDFVRRLLVLGEEQRMGVKEAKKHSWFSNDFHRVDFEEVYHRATKHWRPRTLKTPVIEMIDASQLRELPWLHKADPIGQRNNRKRNLVPMDPPYKPYPRRMSLSLLPRRRIGQSFTMSDEVRIAIEEKWSPGKGQARASHAEPDKVPALIPDVESNDLGQPLSEPRTPEACKQSLFHTSSPAFTSPFRPLVKAQSSMSKQTIPKSSRATEVSTDQEKANLALPKAICSKDVSTVPITERESGEPAQMTTSPALTADRTTSDGATSAGKETVNAEDGEHAAGDEDTADGAADLSHREQAIIAEHSSDDNKSKPRPRGRNFKVNKCESSSQTATISPAKELNNKGITSAAYSAEVGLEGVDMERPTLKLRSRLPTHLKTASERRSNPKKRRGSIYDLEEDDCADQNQHGLRKTKLDSDWMNLQPGSAWKKPKLGHNQGAQKIVHSESRLDLRGGGGFSAIRDGFMDFYFPR